MININIVKSDISYMDYILALGGCLYNFCYLLDTHTMFPFRLATSLGYLEPCFLRKLRNRLLHLNHVVFSGKTEA